jgi:hypothetical protein
METKQSGYRIHRITILAGFGALVAINTVVQRETAASPKQPVVATVQPTAVQPTAVQPTAAANSLSVAPPFIFAQNEPTRVEAPLPPDEGEPKSRLVSPSDHVVADETIDPAVATCIPVSVCEHKLHLSARRFLVCHPGTTPAALEIVNPADCRCCCYEVEVCLPSCCTGAPISSSRVGLFQRGIVEYCWPCGWRARIVFRASGDIVVHYDAN